jgi:alkaline phosphatase D
MVADDLDLIVHLGDYIYENRGLETLRRHAAPEAHTLDDYRQRYAIYKSDPSLQQAHAACPWLVTWDDHEVSNDYADRHSQFDDPAELFLARRAAAYQAYYEHLPLPRQLVPFGAHQRLHTRQRFGRLLEIVLLDGRQYRSKQACGGRRVNPCAELFANERTMLGQAQEAWLGRALPDMRARFNLFAQQTVFAHMDQAPGEEVGYWDDGWSGYPAARQRLIDQLALHGTRNPVILSGDVHGFLVNDVHRRPGDNESPIAATEIVTTSISSSGPPQATFDQWQAENDNVRFARSDRRGYTRLTLEQNALQAELMAVDDVSQPDSTVSRLAHFEVEDGRPGMAR